MKTLFFTAVLFFVGCSGGRTDPYAHLPEHQKKMIRAKELYNQAASLCGNVGQDLRAPMLLLDSAIALYPKYFQAYRGKAALLWKLKDYDALLEVNTILRKLLPQDDWQWDFHRAMVLEASGAIQNAKIYFDSGLYRYRKFYSTVSPQVEVPYLMYYIDFLSFCGLQKESDQKLKELKDKYAGREPSWMNYKANTKEEWMRWNLGYDATDYSGPEWSNWNR